MGKSWTSLVLLTAILAGGCANRGAKNPSNPQPPITQDPVAPQKSPMGNIASIDGRGISTESLIKPLIEAHGLTVLLNLAQLEVAKKLAEDQHVTVSEQDIKNELQLSLRKMAGDEAKEEDFPSILDQFLNQQRLSRSEFDVLMELNAYLRKLAEPTIHGRLTEDQLRQAFAVWYGETVLVRHIQCLNMVEIGEVQRRLAAGEDFSELARQLSRNPKTAPLGGEMPTFSRATQDIPESFKETAFSLKEGEVSGPVQAYGAYHLIKQIRKISPKIVKFEDVKESIQKKLEEQLLQAQINQLRANIGAHVVAALKIDDTVLKKQFEAKITQSESQVQGEKKISDQIKREREIREADPTTAPANATKPAGEPPATATSPTTAPATPSK